MYVRDFYRFARLEDASLYDGLFDEAADGKWDYANQLHPLRYHEKRLGILNNAIAQSHSANDTHDFCSYLRRDILMGDLAIPDSCITTADLDMSLLWSLYGGTTRVMNWFKVRYCEMTVDQLQSRLDAYERQHPRYYKTGDHELIIAGSARCMLLQDVIKRVQAQGKRKTFDLVNELPPWGSGRDVDYLSKIAAPLPQSKQRHDSLSPGKDEGLELFESALGNTTTGQFQGWPGWGSDNSLLAPKDNSYGYDFDVDFLHSADEVQYPLEIDAMAMISQKSPVFVPVDITPMKTVPVKSADQTAMEDDANDDKVSPKDRSDSMTVEASHSAKPSKFTLQDITPHERQSNAENLPPRRTSNTRSSGFFDSEAFATPGMFATDFTHRKKQLWSKIKQPGCPTYEVDIPYDLDSPPAIDIILPPIPTESPEDVMDVGSPTLSLYGMQIASMLKNADTKTQIMNGIDQSVADHVYHFSQSSQFQRTVPEMRGGHVASPKKRQCSGAESPEKRHRAIESDNDEDEELDDSDHSLYASVSEKNA